MRKFLIWYVLSYVGITIGAWISYGIHEIVIIQPEITNEKGLIDEPALLSHLARTIPPYFLTKTLIFALVPLFFSIVRQRWQNLVGTWGILALLSIIGDFVFGVLGSALFFRLVEWLFF